VNASSAGWSRNVAIALCLIAAAVVLRWLLDPWLGDYLPLATLYGVVAASVWMGSYLTAVPVVLIGYVLAHYLFVHNRDLSVGQIAIGAVTYLISCSLIIVIGEAMRRARSRAEVSARQLAREVTKREAAEARLREVNGQLHGRVAELEALLDTLSFGSCSRDDFSADELELLQVICRYVAAAYERLRLIERLRDADRRKDQFLATLAHELRNPLAPMRNAVHILNMSPALPPQLQWVRGVLDRQIGQMARLLEDLFDVSRIACNKLELRQAPVQLAEIVRTALETSRPLIEASHHQLHVSFPPEPIWLEADAVRLAQVFANLLNNASKYTEAGGHIALTAHRQGNEVVICVKDDGIGIEPEALPHVFEMFAQAKPALERSQGGLGIGLSLAKALVELHGGAIVHRAPAAHGGRASRRTGARDQCAAASRHASDFGRR